MLKYIYSFVFILCSISVAKADKAENVLMKTKIKIASMAPEGSPWYKILKEEFCDQIEADQTSQLSCQIITNDEQEAIRKITLSRKYVSSNPPANGGIFTGRTLGGLLRLCELPFTFENNDQAMKCLSSLKGKIAKNLEEKMSFKLLGLIGLGNVYFVTTKEVKKFADLKGLKIWSWGDDPFSRIIIEKLQLTGVPLSLADVRFSLEQNNINAAYATPSAFMAFQWASVIKYFINTPLSFAAAAFTLDLNTWNKLNETQKQVIEKASEKTINAVNAENIRANNEAIEVFKSKSSVSFIAFEAKDLQEALTQRTDIVNALAKEGNLFSPAELALFEKEIVPQIIKEKQEEKK